MIPAAVVLSSYPPQKFIFGIERHLCASFIFYMPLTSHWLDHFLTSMWLNYPFQYFWVITCLNLYSIFTVLKPCWTVLLGQLFPSSYISVVSLSCTSQGWCVPSAPVIMSLTSSFIPGLLSRNLKSPASVCPAQALAVSIFIYQSQPRGDSFPQSYFWDTAISRRIQAALCPPIVH